MARGAGAKKITVVCVCCKNERREKKDGAEEDAGRRENNRGGFAVVQGTKTDVAVIHSSRQI